MGVTQSRVNFHQALKAQGFGWHSDFTPLNGALMVIPGSHKHFLASAEPGFDKMYSNKLQKPSLERSPDCQTMAKIIEQSPDQRGIEYCCGRAGDVILFDCN